MPQSVQISGEEFGDLNSTVSSRLVDSLQGRLHVKENQQFLKVGLTEARVKVRKTDRAGLEGVLYYQSESSQGSLFCPAAWGKMSFLNDLTNFFFGILLQLVHFQVPERM